VYFYFSTSSGVPVVVNLRSFKNLVAVSDVIYGVLLLFVSHYPHVLKFDK
jgi:hypothetical protein